MDSPRKTLNTKPDSTMDARAEREKLPWVLAEPEEREDYEGQTNPIGLVVIAGLFALLWFAAGPRYFLVVVGLVVMIFLHELGHFATAKWTGMKVTQFFLFMGPRVWSFRRGETEYGVRLFPVGAFVRIVGMNNLDPCDPEDEPRAYRNKSYPRRLLVISAGSIMHFVQALVLFVVVTSVIGLNDPGKWTVGRLSALSETQPPPAAEIGLQPGDDIIAVDGVDSTQWGDTVDYIKARPGQEVTLTVVRGSETFDADVELAEIPAGEGDGTWGFLGVGPQFERTREGPWAGVKLLGDTSWTAITSIPQFFSPSTISQLATLLFSGSESVSIDSDEAQRPVSVVGAVRIAGQPDFDVTVPLTLLGVFNVFLGILNMMPLLPLDGGHAAIATYERIRSRKGRRYHVDVAKLLPMTYAVVLLIGFIMVSTVILDIVRPIG